MAESIKVFENSLRDYLINVQTDAYNKPGKVEHKYNNLKVYMEPRRIRIPHFYVSVNISSACFQIDPIEVISGSLDSDEKFIIHWASRPNINGELKKHWIYLTNSKDGLRSSQVKNTKDVEEIIKLPESEINEATDIITGSGLKKRCTLKGFEKRLWQKH